ncbi:hypothetical protein ANO11243_081190 [Dothideomycetidae sp. 11243]|nr:hypothetical protein ANO11243_081190 [fungal sp. No.11243]
MRGTVTSMVAHYPVGGEGPKLLAIGWATFFVAALCTVLRYFVASQINGRWRWDFIWATLATLVTTGAIITYTLAVLNGVGNYMVNVTYTNVFNSIYYTYCTIYIGLVAITLAKYSVIALLLQIEGPLAKKRRIALYCIGAFFTVVNFIMIPIAITQCVPNNRLWYRYLPGSCPREELSMHIAVFQGYTTSVTDLILAVWPIWLVSNLSQPLAVKVKVCLLMAINVLPGAISIVRTTTIPNTSAVVDVTHAFSDFVMYCCLELGLIIILTSIPVLRPLFKRGFDKILPMKTTMDASSRSPPGQITVTLERLTVRSKAAKDARDGEGDDLDDSEKGLVSKHKEEIWS